MVGMSAFFAGSFHNLFITQQKLSDTQGQFSLNEIIRSKFTDVKSVIDTGFLQTDTSDGQLPFTYIEKSSDNKLVFKDFFIFNGLYGSKSSDEFKDEIDNPAGITYITSSSKYYVTAPLENAIYECTTLPNSCDALSIPGLELNQPTGITSATIGTKDYLFVADSGNNRVIKINLTDLPLDYSALVDEGLNYPTGVAYWNGLPYPYIFIADTYNNKVKKISPSVAGDTLITVVGEGDDKTCTGTAKYCKLTFPTGLAVDQANNALYIADTGKNRILKISEPSSDLSSYKVDFTLDTATEISQINFSFPTATSLKNPPSITNDLHAGRYNTVGTTYAYLLSTPILNGDLTKDCTPATDPPSPTEFCFERFTVSDENNLFRDDDEIILGTDPFIFIVDFINLPNEVHVTDTSKKTAYAAGTMAKLTKEFSAGPYEFDFNLTDSDFNIFNNVNVEVFDGDGDSIKKVSQTFTIGNGILGTDEDRIEVSSTGLDYPTGLGFSSVDGLHISDTHTFYTDKINSFDYTSDFDIESLSFTIKNTGTILETTIVTDAPEETDKKTYKLNATLSEL